MKFDAEGAVTDAYAHDMKRNVVGRRGDTGNTQGDGKLPDSIVVVGKLYMDPSMPRPADWRGIVLAADG